MNNIILREWKKLKYHDPEIVLSEFRKIEENYFQIPLPQNVRNLRTHNLKNDREGREAALFCIGLSKYMGRKVIFSPTESSDYDFVVCWVEEDTMNYTGVQLKELVPEHLNPAAELNDLISGLERYKDSSNLIVAIHLNRRIQLDINTLTIPKLNLAGLFLFGAASEDQKNGCCGGIY